MTGELNTAVDIFRVKRRAGLRKSLGGLDYTRSVEYPHALDALDLDAAQRVLEIGSSKLFLGCYIAVRYGSEVHVTDLDPVVRLQERWITRLGAPELLASGRFVARIEDATQLSYADESFDRVVSISTIEHVRDIAKAAAEVGRVLRPGGLAVITVPFSRERREIFRDHAPYGGSGSAAAGPIFYEYHLDLPMLEERVVRPSGLSVRKLRFLGEPGFKMSRLVYHPLLGKPLSLFRWLWPYTAHRWYREIPQRQVTSGAENIALLVLEKSSQHQALTPGAA